MVGCSDTIAVAGDFAVTCSALFGLGVLHDGCWGFPNCPGRRHRCLVATALDIANSVGLRAVFSWLCNALRVLGAYGLSISIHGRGADFGVSGDCAICVVNGAANS